MQQQISHVFFARPIKLRDNVILPRSTGPTEKLQCPRSHRSWEYELKMSWLLAGREAITVVPRGLDDADLGNSRPQGAGQPLSQLELEPFALQQLRASRLNNVSFPPCLFAPYAQAQTQPA